MPAIFKRQTPAKKNTLLLLTAERYLQLCLYQCIRRPHSRQPQGIKKLSIEAANFNLFNYLFVTNIYSGYICQKLYT